MRKTDVPHEEIEARVMAEAARLAGMGGLRSISMRALALAAGCAIGTVYNVVGNLDAIILRLNAATTAELTGRLEAAIADIGAPLDRAHALAAAYVDAAQDHPKLWNVLYEHTMPEGEDVPDWYYETLSRPIRLVHEVLTPFYADPADRERHAAALWAALHGVAVLATSNNKLAFLSGASPHAIARTIVDAHLAGRL